ncbi:MAG: hypothetical protein G01um101438_442 [Parcubacteria group bacterium Gr01-1014_38]|nr:MAG: hypothetical protein G01um101438_442 [Parcubacteria group bacterium Gr01-1014_38]
MNQRSLFLLALTVVSIVLLGLVSQFYAPALATRVFLLF